VIPRDISKRDVEQAFRILVRDVAALGHDVTGWTLEHGSATNGVSFRLCVTLPAGRVPSLMTTNGAIGRTRREAYTFLHSASLALQWHARMVRERER
jgi:hypothetical protein